MFWAFLCGEGGEHISRYGIVDVEPVSERLFRVKGLVEKPRPEEAPSTWGIVGRYVLTPGIFGWMLLAGLTAYRDISEVRFDITAADNLRARRRRTRPASCCRRRRAACARVSDGDLGRSHDCQRE